MAHKPVAYDLVIRRGISFEPLVAVMYDLDDEVVDLTGCKVYAEVRQDPDSEVILDLQPEITDPMGGEITVPELNYIQLAYLPGGIFWWDLVIETAEGHRLDPFIYGTVTVLRVITQPVLA